MLETYLLGTSGMQPLPYRSLSSAVMFYQNHGILIDAGEGTQCQLDKIKRKVKSIEIICLTHFHADHILGLAGVLINISNAGRTEPLTIIGPVGLKECLKHVCFCVQKLNFRIKAVELSEKEETIDFGGYTLTGFQVKHSVTCYGYSFYAKRFRKVDVEKAEKYKVPMEYWSELKLERDVTAPDGKVYTPSMILGEPLKGLKVTYCTDSRPCKAIVKNAKHSDLFICEGMYVTNQFREQAEKKYHMLFEEAATLAQEAEVKELWLTHYSPTFGYRTPNVGGIKRIFTNVKAGEDLMSTTLVWPE